MIQRVVFASVAMLLLLSQTGCGIGDAQKQLRTAVDAQRDSLQACYAEALTREATASGKVQAWLHVNDSEGRLERVEVIQSDLSDEQFQACMDRTLEAVKLDEPPAANLKVEYTFQFTPQG